MRIVFCQFWLGRLLGKEDIQSSKLSPKDERMLFEIWKFCLSPRTSEWFRVLGHLRVPKGSGGSEHGYLLRGVLTVGIMKAGLLCPGKSAKSLNPKL